MHRCDGRCRPLDDDPAPLPPTPGVEAVRVTDGRRLRRLALGLLLPGFDGVSPPRWLLDRLEEGLAGVVLFERNVPARDPDPGVAALVARLREVAPHVLVCIDEEGGDLTRLDHATGSVVPGSAALGHVDDAGLTERLARSLGARLALAGVDLDLAPVADLDTDPLNPVIGTRSFGSDPAAVARHVAAFVAGLQSQGVAATAKHFPGHGATREDSHLTVPTVSADRALLERRELVPFRAAVDARAAVVMTAHVVVPALDHVPATLSRRVVTDLLRGELGFDGVVMSDGLDMHAISRTVGHADGAVRALGAGVDALCVGGDSTGPEVVEHLLAAVVDAVRSGSLAEERLVEAAGRVRALVTSLSSSRSQRSLRSRTASDLRGLGAEAAQRALVVHGDVRLPAAPLVVELHEGPSAALGDAPWGIGRHLARVVPGTVVVESTPAGPDPAAVLVAHPGRPVVLAVRGVRRSSWQRETLRLVREQRPDVVVVDQGAPGPADLLGPRHLATRSGSSASAVVAAALLGGTAGGP